MCCGPWPVVVAQGLFRQATGGSPRRPVAPGSVFSSSNLPRETRAGDSEGSSSRFRTSPRRWRRTMPPIFQMASSPRSSGPPPDTPPRMTQNGLPIARPTPNTSQLSCESSCRWAVCDTVTVFGWGSRPLVFFARYLAGRLERPAVLPCVAQTGVVSPVGGDQAPRYHPWGLL